MKIRDIVKTKDLSVVTIGPEETLRAAVQILVDNNIGALPVCEEDGTLLGIISERDLLKQFSLRTGDLDNIKVEEVMTRDVAVGYPDDDLDYASTVMKKKRIRHLPILSGKKVEAIISQRDINEIQLKETTARVRYAGLLRNTPPTRRRLV
jgi:CBS domain-containing protein